MLKVGTKILVKKHGKEVCEDEITRVLSPVAYSKMGRRFSVNAQVLKPLGGDNNYGHTYEVKNEQ